MLSRARALWRSARSWPLAQRLIVAADRLWWARVIDHADIVDLEFVAALTGRDLSARKAVRLYVRGGFSNGFSLNPLFVERTVSRQLSDADRVPALYAYLVNDRAHLEVSPNWSAVGYARRAPDALHDPAGPFGAVWRAMQRGAPVPLGTADDPVDVDAEAFTRMAAAAARETRTAPEPAEHRSSPLRASTILAVWAVGDAEDDADAALRRALEVSAALRSELVVATRRPTPDAWVQAALATLWAPGLRLLRREAAVEELLDEATRAWSGTILIRGEGADISAADAVALAAAGSSAPTAPLWLAPDGTVASAGIVDVGGSPAHLLAGHPPEDARALGDTIQVGGIAGGTRAFPSDGTGDPRTLLTAAVVAPRMPLPPDAAARPSTAVDELLAPAGLRVSGSRAGDTDVELVYSRTNDRSQADPPRLRWAIKIASPAGVAGESWGDTHFARGIAKALRRLGQDVVIDPLPAHNRPSTYLDDVTLVLRGPRRIDPPPAQRSLLWVISHPDEVTADEVAGFDCVFAASVPWARAATDRFGHPVRPLLQCTETSVFRPTGTPRGSEIVFVGTARGIARPSVVGPLKAGIPVRVYGPDWRGYIPGSAIAATGVANQDLGALYERAAVVLNDHWPAMKAQGFISNRPYDVVAAGGRVISDDVEGMEAVFGGAVVTYRDVTELVELLRSDLDAAFPPDDDLALISQRVRERDSFDARARELLRAAVARHDAEESDGL